METLAEYPYSASTRELPRPVEAALESRSAAAAEAAMAGLLISLLDQIAAQAFALLDVFLTDNSAGLALSREAQELIAEGEMLQHRATPDGPSEE